MENELEIPGVGEVGEVARRMIAQARARRTHFLAGLRAGPQSTYCREHMTHMAIDYGASARAMAPQFEACPGCVEKEVRGRLISAGVTPNLAGSTLNNWVPYAEKDKEVLENVRAFARARRGVLVLLGRTGIGKTHLAVGVMRHYPTRPKFITHAALMKNIRGRYDDYQLPDEDTACRRARLLVLDEFGLTTGGRDELSTTHEVINHRMGHGLPTVITGNMPLSRFEAVAGERIVDRLKDYGWKIWEMKGDSRRGTNRDV